MTKFDIRQFAISSVGAIALSATCVLAAVGPVRAAAPVATAAWAQTIERQISNVSDPAASRVPTGKVAETVLALRFTPEGGFAGASVVRSSGDAVLDRAALAAAGRITYPALPTSDRGQGRTVTMRLAFGGEEDVARHFRQPDKGRVDVLFAASPADGSFRIAAK